MTPTSGLAERLSERIRCEGPITFRDWMNAALYDEHEGYYCRSDRKPWGREGDYRTSPERSPLFAATFANYFAQLYRNLHSPTTWTILEAGAGAGNFASGVLATLRDEFPEVFAATTYVVDEVGAGATLADELAPFKDHVQFKSLQDCDQIVSGIVFSNELLDSFPVHRVTAVNGELHELCVTVIDAEAFAWTTRPLMNPALQGYLAASGITLANGQTVDINLEIQPWLEAVARKLKAGYLITVDYGAEAIDLYDAVSRPQGTLRGFYRHDLVDDLLARPGEQDLTSSIDWSYVKSCGAGLEFDVVKFERQDKFLLQAGLLEEMERLCEQAADEVERMAVRNAAREMVLPNGMAAHFQVLVQKRGLFDL